MNRRRFLSTALPLVAAPFVASGCGTGVGARASQAKNKLRLATILPGKSDDGSYSQLGMEGIRAAQKLLGADVVFKTDVNDIDKSLSIMQGWVADGYNTVWTHGSQFSQVAMRLAEQNAAVTVISEDDRVPADIPPNLWVLDRNFHTPFYPVGVLAARTTKTRKIGYVAGLSLRFTFAELHALKQAVADVGTTPGDGDRNRDRDSDSDIEVLSTWTEDFDDPVKGRTAAQELLSKGCDVIISGLDLGTQGLLEAVKAKAQGTAWATGLYTNTQGLAPDHYLTGVLTDFTTPVVDILSRIRAGERSGYYPMDFESGLLLSNINASENIRNEVQTAIDKVMRGEVKVNKNINKPAEAPPPID